MATTKIEWATHTMNDQAGCTKVSPACTHCYALLQSVRIGNMGDHARYKDVTNGSMKIPAWSGKVNCDLDARRRNFTEIRGAAVSRYTFYGSMTDLWHESLAIDGEVLQVLAEEVEKLRTGCRVPQVVMFLTKRTDRLLAWQRHHFPKGLPDQVWVGATVEDQARADERIPVLTQVDARVRYLSCEPLLGPIDLGGLDPLEVLQNLEWVIVGGESGRSARPTDPMWVRELRDQSKEAGIPFHFKQWGEWGETGERVGKKKAGRELDGRTWDENPPLERVILFPTPSTLSPIPPMAASGA